MEKRIFSNRPEGIKAAIAATPPMGSWEAKVDWWDTQPITYDDPNKLPAYMEEAVKFLQQISENTSHL